MTVLEAYAPTLAEPRCPFSVTDGSVGHWSLLLDGSPNSIDPALAEPTADWAGSKVTRLEAPTRTTWVFGDLYGPQRERLKTRILEDRPGTLFDGQLINGHCAILSVGRGDRGPRTFNVWTNRFGTMHVYVVKRPGKTLLTSCYSKAADFSSRELDWAAVARYARQGFFPSDRTHFEDVKVLRPYSRYEWSQGGQLLEEEQYWEWPSVADFAGTYQDALDEFSFLLQTVCVEMCSEGSVAVPISGGLDSRSTIAALPEATWQQGNAFAFSYGYDASSVEIQIARKLAACRGLPFESYVIGPYLFEHRKHLFQTTGGLQDITQTRQEAVLERLSKRSNRVLAAHWGDVWLDTQIAINENSTVPLARKALKKFLKPGGEQLLSCLDSGKPDTEFDSLDVLEGEFAEELRAYDSIADPDLKLKAWKTDNWSHRFTIPNLRVYQSYLFPKLVFYDTRLSDFLSSLPSSFLEGRKIQVDLIKRRAPDLARVRWQAYDANLYLAPFNDTLLLPARVLRKLKRMRLKKTATVRNWEVQFRGEKNLARLEAALTDPKGRIYQVTRPKQVRLLLDQFRVQPTRETGYAVSQLLTLATVFEEVGL